MKYTLKNKTTQTRPSVVWTVVAGRPLCTDPTICFSRKRKTSVRGSREGYVCSYQVGTSLAHVKMRSSVYNL
ncbi:MAG: hypothetical protein LUF04_13735 [Bacteroides sp.]|nr:hypothetical protein [Bacteroides sp.]